MRYMALHIQNAFFEILYISLALILSDDCGLRSGLGVALNHILNTF
jgi:hypothetical protein